MKSGLTPTQLCRKHANERLHSARVTELALELFDRTRKALRLPGVDRRLLAAAARLHDVGFASLPRDHARRSAAIVEWEGLGGFSADERAVIAGAIGMHTGRVGGAARPGAPAGARRRARRVGALLRVADALDHAHIQTVSIEGIRIKGRQVRVEICSPGYPGVLRQAERKADLWNAAMPVPIRFKLKKPGCRSRAFGGVLRPRQPVREALRRLMFLHFRLMQDAREDILRRDETEDLHDLRVAMRRLRVALRMYGEWRPSRTADRIGRALAGLGDRLGGIRDLQVWSEFLRALPRRVAREDGAGAYRRSVERQRRTDGVRLRRILRGREWQAVARAVALFLRVEAPGTTAGGTFRRVAAAQVRRVFARIGKEVVDARRMSSDDYHELRRSVRRGRYRAEFLAPVGGRTVIRLAVRLKAVADSLGDLHDADVRLALLAGRRTGRPLPRLKAAIGRRRTRALSDFQRAWSRLHSARFRKRALKELGELRRGNGGSG